MSQHQYYPQLKWKPAEYESLMLLDQTTLSGLLKSGLAFDSFGIAPSFKYVDTFIFPKQLSEHHVSWFRLSFSPRMCFIRMAPFGPTETVLTPHQPGINFNAPSRCFSATTRVTLSITEE